MYTPMLVTVILGIFSTTVMSYISMATPIGPWIAPTIVLCSLLVYCWFYTQERLQTAMVYTTISASIGGILATAFGFTFPTLYFLDHTLFDSMLARPVYFASLCSSIAFIAGWYGIWIANLTETIFINKNGLPFPIAQLIYKMITAQQQLRKAIELAIGFVATTLLCVFQDGLYVVQSIIPKTILMNSEISYYCITLPSLQFDLWPMLWAIGFVTGQVIVVPLLIGSLSKIMVAQPLQVLLFPEMQLMDFILAFCSGMVVSGVLGGFVPKNISCLGKARESIKRFEILNFLRTVDRALVYEGCGLLLLTTLVLSYFGFSYLAQLYLLLFTFVCAYQIILIAGKIGLAQLGRFATFVLVPALFLFQIDFIQITIISTFVETCTGVAVDALCGRKVVALSGANRWYARWYQYMGLIISSITVGIVFWLLISNFQLGSAELFAQRGQARALLIHAQQFNYWVVLIGIVYGLVLKQLKLSPMLVLGGLLMPLNISIGLVLGGLLTLCIKDAQEWYPFWSGVFAANSIWMLIKSII